MRLLLISIPLLTMACSAKDGVDTSEITDTGSGDTDSNDTDIDTDTDDSSDTAIEEIVDEDGDGVLAEEDCDDSNPDLGAMSEDGDCDGVTSGFDCDDSDPDASYTYSSSLTDYQIDGSIDATSEYYELYDGNSNLVFIYNERDEDGDGLADFAVTTEQVYDSAGNLVDYRAYEESLDQSYYTDTHIVYTYSPDNLLLSEAEISTGFNEDGNFSESTTTMYTYNPENQMDTRVITIDDDSDGLANESYEAFYLYDSEGHLIELTENGDTDGDGNIDTVLIGQYIWVNQLLIQRDIGRDNDLDGIMEMTETRMYLYDGSENVIHEEVIFNIPAFSLVSITLRGYTPENWLETEEIILDIDADGLINQREFTNYTYDGVGNILTRIYSHDDNFDGTDDMISMTSNVYDSENRIIEMMNENDVNADGVTDESALTTYNYDGCESF